MIEVVSGKMNWDQMVKNLSSSNVEFRLYSIGIRIPLEVSEESSNMIRFFAFRVVLAIVWGMG